MNRQQLQKCSVYGILAWSVNSKGINADKIVAIFSKNVINSAFLIYNC